jgi:predicted secreted Zn-dependent protease
MAAGEPLAEASFHTTHGERGRIDALVPVGYARAGLRIDSDCREWSVRLMPLRDPDLAISLEQRSYPVRGESLEELTAQVDQVKGRWAAYSEWLTRWTITTRRAEDGSACAVTAGEAAVEVSLTLPDWRKPGGVDAAVEARWQAFVQSLLVHELGHVTIAIQGAAAIEHLLDAGLSASSCEQAGEEADAAARRIFERYARATRRYDEETEHGLTQGTGLW